MGDRTHEEKPWKGDTTMPHSLADLLIHVIFLTKDRRPNLDEDLRSRLFPCMAGIVSDPSCPGTPQPPDNRKFPKPAIPVTDFKII